MARALRVGRRDPAGADWKRFRNMWECGMVERSVVAAECGRPAHVSRNRHWVCQIARSAVGDEARLVRLDEGAQADRLQSVPSWECRLRSCAADTLQGL